jgi:predicted chitinase
MMPIDGQVMFEIAPRFSGSNAKRQAEIIAEISPVLASTLASYGIDTRLRIAHFLGQTCHESAGFRTTEEFASGEAYEGRKDLGNIKKGDGPLYKGRGLIQLTGRTNYKTLGTVLGIDLEKYPLRAADPILSLKIACEYWKRGRSIPTAIATTSSPSLRKSMAAPEASTIAADTRARPRRHSRASRASNSPARRQMPARCCAAARTARL